MGWRAARHTRRTNSYTCDDCTEKIESHYVGHRTVRRKVHGLPQVFAFIEYDIAPFAANAVLIDTHAFFSEPLPLHHNPRTRSSHSRKTYVGKQVLEQCDRNVLVKSLCSNDKPCVCFDGLNMLKACERVASLFERARPKRNALLTIN